MHLQISMINSLTMTIIHTINELLEVSTRLSFTKSPMVDLETGGKHHGLSKYAELE